MTEKIRHRDKRPIRTFTKTYKDYKTYKKPLIDDFNSRCGYCDCHDFWIGGPRFYHIDHFKPKSIFPKLETEYSNLVYSCPFCNVFKSDDWSDKYVDPCDEQYDTHFYRDKLGNIIPETDSGGYIYTKLHLYLLRHSVVWNLSRIRNIINSIHEIVKEHSEVETDERIRNIKEKHYELTVEFFRYLGDLGKVQKE